MKRDNLHQLAILNVNKAIGLQIKAQLCHLNNKRLPELWRSNWHVTIGMPRNQISFLWKKCSFSRIITIQALVRYSSILNLCVPMIQGPRERRGSRWKSPKARLMTKRGPIGASRQERVRNLEEQHLRRHCPMLERPKWKQTKWLFRKYAIISMVKSESEFITILQQHHDMARVPNWLQKKLKWRGLLRIW